MMWMQTVVVGQDYVCAESWTAVHQVDVVDVAVPALWSASAHCPPPLLVLEICSFLTVCLSMGSLSSQDMVSVVL
eukprot:6116599-Amphidinium_carterae.1